MKQILNGNNRIEFKVDGPGTRVDSTSERMLRLEAEMVDIPQARYPTVACIIILDANGFAGDSASTTTTAAASSKGMDRPDEMEGPIISFTSFPPNRDNFEIKKKVEDTVLPMLSPKHGEGN